MPVIRGEPKVTVVTDELRRQVIDQLERELSGEVTENGPVIFEIPFDRDFHHEDTSGNFDVLVVWNAWKPFNSEERSKIIRDVYQESPINIVQALGVTLQEAAEQQLLPYAVIPMVQNYDKNELEQLRNEMIMEGGFKHANGHVDLRFPTMRLAEQVHRRLTDRSPKGYWTLVQNVDSTPQID
jgi:hypothetical protein